MSSIYLPPTKFISSTSLPTLALALTLVYLTLGLTACQSVPTQNTQIHTHAQSVPAVPVLSQPKPYVIVDRPHDNTNDEINDNVNGNVNNDINNDINNNMNSHTNDSTANPAMVNDTRKTDVAVLTADLIFINPAKAENLAKSSVYATNDSKNASANSNANNDTTTTLDKNTATADTYQLTTPTAVSPTVIDPTTASSDEAAVASQNSDNVADYMIGKPSAQDMREALLRQARSNSSLNQTNARRKNSTQNDTLPAFRHLMDTGIKQLQANQVSEAEATFTRAQRLAPSSSAVYFYLSQVALKKRQPHKAEAMARRGLVVAEDNQRKRMLWQVILLSAQMRNDARLARQASDNLAKF